METNISVTVLYLKGSWYNRFITGEVLWDNRPVHCKEVSLANMPSD